MKKFFEGFKDFLYDSIDYLIVLSILGVVALVIGWRLELLFANDALDIINEDGQVIDSNIDEKDYNENEDNDSNENRDNDSTDTTIGNENQEGIIDEENNTNDENNKDNEVVEKGKIVKVVIPDGSLPSKIGTILEDMGLISSRGEFVEKSQELNLDTKLKSGNYDIEEGTSLENIIRIIAK